MNYVGIDCGLDGAICVIGSSGRILSTRRMPTVKKGKGREIDLPELWNLIKFPVPVGDYTIGIEDPGGHAASAAGLRGMTYSFAAVMMCVVISKHRHTIYSAVEWQRVFWKKPKMAKGQKFNTKAAALVAAKRLWPDQGFLATAKSKVPHDGIVDALLIAEATRRIFK